MSNIAVGAVRDELCQKASTPIGFIRQPVERGKGSGGSLLWLPRSCPPRSASWARSSSSCSRRPSADPYAGVAGSSLLPRNVFPRVIGMIGALSAELPRPSPLFEHCSATLGLEVHVLGGLVCEMG